MDDQETSPWRRLAPLSGEVKSFAENPCICGMAARVDTMMGSYVCSHPCLLFSLRYVVVATFIAMTNTELLRVTAIHGSGAAAVNRKY